MKKIFGFTLAEVLITLTIIGVIAAITIPTLMRKWSDHADVQKVKEAYSILSNAFKMAIRENDATVTDWNWPNAASWNKHQVNGDYLAEQLIPFLKVKTYCGSNIKAEHCYSFGANKSQVRYYKALNNNNLLAADIVSELGGRMMLGNGMTIAFRVYYPQTITRIWSQFNYANNYIGSVLVDINGQKGPNQFGIDVFYLPFGQNGMMVNNELIKNSSDYFPDHSKNNCSNRTSNGASCGVWVLLHGNMDYKYRDVSAEW